MSLCVCVIVCIECVCIGDLDPTYRPLTSGDRNDPTNRSATNCATHEINTLSPQQHLIQFEYVYLFRMRDFKEFVNDFMTPDRLIGNTNWLCANIQILAINHQILCFCRGDDQLVK